MRISELQENMYIKSIDTVEQYLLSIIQKYFENNDEAIEGSIEFIIQEAVNRIQQELDYNSLGVLKIKFPDGTEETGDVTITLDKLNGEPLISPKLSAFNVNFGNQANTACEGNDPRLSDPRMPIKHTHPIDDVLGLEGLISSLLGKINKNDVYSHVHTNKNVLDKIIYTGKKDKIDLVMLDDFEEKLNTAINNIKNKIITYSQETQEKIDAINANLVILNNKIDAFKEYVITKCEEYLTEAKGYTDTIFTESVTNTKQWIDDNYVKKEHIQKLIDIANSVYTLVGTSKWDYNLLKFELDDDKRVVELELDENILNELQHREIGIGESNDIIFKFFFQYEVSYDGASTVYKQPLPYLDNFSIDYEPYIYPLYKKSTVSGYIKMMKSDTKFLKLVVMNDDNKLPSEMKEGTIVCDVYARDLCPKYP